MLTSPFPVFHFRHIKDNTPYTQNSFRSTKVYSKNGRSDIAEAKYFSDEGIIIGEGRFSDRDLNVPDQKLRPSDLTFLQWKSAAGDAIKSLRGYVGRNILSKSTIETMQKAQRDTRQPLSEKATFKRGADTPEKKAAFNMMMGTDFISSLGYMLKDHAPVRASPPFPLTRLVSSLTPLAPFSGFVHPPSPLLGH